MNLKEVVLEEAAKAGKSAPSDDMIEYIIWEHTGYPCFWGIPGNGATPEECFRKQLAEYFASLKK